MTDVQSDVTWYTDGGWDTDIVVRLSDSTHLTLNVWGETPQKARENAARAIAAVGGQVESAWPPMDCTPRCDDCGRSSEEFYSGLCDDCGNCPDHCWSNTEGEGAGDAV